MADPKTWLHGTRHEFAPGDLVGPPRTWHAWAALSEEDAHDYAHQAKGDGRPRVYEVEPTGLSKYADDDDQYKSASPMRVTRERPYQGGCRQCDREVGKRTAARLEHFEAANQEGGELPDLSAHFPQTRLPWHAHPSSTRHGDPGHQFLNELLDTPGAPSARAEGRDMPKGQPRYTADTTSLTGPPPGGSKEGDSPFIPAGSKEDPAGRLKSLWDHAHYPNSGYSEEQKTGLRAQVRSAWSKADGIADCRHSECPPWQCREKRTAAVVAHFEAAEGGHRLMHTAPGPEAGHHPLHHYTGDDPDEPVRVYRSAPAGTESINSGDWVSLSPDYARRHGRHPADPGKDWPVYTAEVPQRHVHWDENDEDEHGYNGPEIHHPDVQDEESGATRGWDDYHGGRQYGQEAWAGASAHLSPEDHEFVHDDCEAEDDRANTLLNAARAQGSLRGARWRDDNFPARDDAEAHAAAHLHEAPEGHRTTAFTVHRTEDGGTGDLDVHHYEPSHDPGKWRRYQGVDLEGWHYRHPEVDKVGTAREAAGDDYRLLHQGPGGGDDDHASPMHDAEGMMPDVYDRPDLYDNYARAGAPHVSRESIVQLRRARGNPEADIDIYRALPRQHRSINQGDWVTPSANYARQHADSNLHDEPWAVIKATVKARHLFNEGDLNEWGYQGPDIENARVHVHGGPRRKEAAVAAHFEGSGAKQREGDERPFGGYTLSYRTDDLGEARPRHVIEARTPDGARVGKLDWYGTTGIVHHVGVAAPEDEPGGDWGDGRDHRRRGLATAMWDWSQEMTPRAKHSRDRTDKGRDWVKGLKNPRKDPPSLPGVVAHQKEAVVAHFEEPAAITVTAAEYGPKPEYRSPPEDASEDEKMAHFERGRNERHGWEAHIRRGLGLGHLDYGRARELGYYGDGSEYPEQLYDHEGNVKVHRGWQALPHDLYHATTDMPAVREHGLKSRAELGQLRGRGLGAGPDDTISLTSDHGTAQNILRAMHEHHDVVSGKKTPAQMVEEARAGHGAARPYLHEMAAYSGEHWEHGEPMPRGLDAKVRGVELKRGGYLNTQKEMDEREGPGWRPHRDSDPLSTRGGEAIYNSWERDASPAHKREDASSLYRDFAVARAHAGGPEDPLFTGTDVHGFAAMDPSKFGIVHVHPRPGAQGFPVSSLNEWRTTSGDALETHRAERLEGGHLHEASLSKEAAMRVFAALENPHTRQQEWYHGSPYKFGDFGSDGPNSDLGYEDDSGDTSHWNTLLGHHFAASHEMAEEFSKGEHGGDGRGDGEDGGPAQNVIHARLELKHPKVYSSEHDMDQEAYEHEFRAGNHHDLHHEPGEPENAREEGYEDDLPRTYRYAGHSDRMRPQSEGDPEYAAMGHYHPYATGWLNAHPDKYGIAKRYRERIQGQGHDGIVYGNEFEKHHGTADQHHVCAIPFREGQIDVTQRHSGAGCIDESSASRQWPGRSQPMLPGMGEHDGSLDVVAHFGEPRTAAPVHMQQKLFHMQPDPTLNGPWSGRHNPEDPEAAYRHRQEHDEDYQPDECPECGGDRHFREQHADEHEAYLEDEDWYTNWEGMDMPSHIHRGMAVHLPQGLHDYVHDESRPAADRAMALAAHVVGHPDSGSQNGLGHYWSESPDQSKGYAEARPPWLRPKAAESPEHTPVMVHARFPGREHIETDPETLRHWKVLKYGYGRDNLEYPISEQAPVHLTGISWARPGHRHPDHDHPLADDPAWTHHEFGGDGIRANATLAVVAHFEEGPLPEYHGEPLYHGTRSILEPGEHLTVEEAKRNANNPDIQTDPYVHATTDPREAHRWGERASAFQAQDRMEQMGRERRIGPGQNAGHAYRPRVYEVEPTGHVEPDLEYADTEHDSYRSAHPMRVKREVEPITCYDCPDTERNEEHWPDHPHYEYLRAQQEEEDNDDWGGHEGSRQVTAASGGRQQHADVGQSMLNVIMENVCDVALAPAGPLDAVVQAAAALGSWEPQDPADAVLAVREFASVLTALREGLLRVARVLEEMPVHPDVAELIHDMAQSLLTAISDAGRLTAALPPEASWQEPGPPNR